MLLSDEESASSGGGRKEEMETARKTMAKRTAKSEIWERTGKEKNPSVMASRFPEERSWKSPMAMTADGTTPISVMIRYRIVGGD